MVRYRFLIALLFICSFADAQTMMYRRYIRADSLYVDSVLVYRGLPFVGMDTTGAGNGTGKKLVFIGGQIVVRNDSVGSGGSIDTTLSWFITAYKLNQRGYQTSEDVIATLEAERPGWGYASMSDTSSWLPTWADILAMGYYPRTGGSITGTVGARGIQTDSLRFNTVIRFLGKDNATYRPFATRSTALSSGVVNLDSVGIIRNFSAWYSLSLTSSRMQYFTPSTMIYNYSTGGSFVGWAADTLLWIDSGASDTLAVMRLGPSGHYWNFKKKLMYNGVAVIAPLGTPLENYVPKWSATAGAPVWRLDTLSTATGGADGQNADSLGGVVGLPLSPYVPSGSKVFAVVRDLDSLKYRHAALGKISLTRYWKGAGVTLDTTGGTPTLSPSLSVPTDFIRSNADMWVPLIQHGNTATAPTAVALVANRLRAFPFIVTKPFSTDSMSFEVTTGVAGCRIALGIYEDQDGDLYPDSLRLDLGAYTCASAVVKRDTITAPLGSTSPGSFTFKPNTLYFVGVHSSSTASLRAVALTSMPSILGWDPALGASTQYTGWNLTSTYTYPTACPNPFTAGATRIANLAAPLLIMRVKP